MKWLRTSKTRFEKAYEPGDRVVHVYGDYVVLETGSDDVERLMEKMASLINRIIEDRPGCRVIESKMVRTDISLGIKLYVEEKEAVPEGYYYYGDKLVPISDVQEYKEN